MGEFQIFLIFLLKVNDMGSDDFFKKKKAALQARKQEQLTPKVNSFLIVSEGKKTEPYYFEGIAKAISASFGEGVSVEKPIINTCGEGKCTVSLVNEAVSIVKKAHIMYEHQWVVFDKDDFLDFDEAIELAEKSGFKAAWSNQSFEFWLYLHFNYSDAALHRNEWVKKLDELFVSRGINPKGYQKNDPNIFEIVSSYGSLSSAVSFAIGISKNHSPKLPPSKQDPCTSVYQLILELKPFLPEYFQDQ